MRTSLYVSIDVETTGLDPDKDRILEIGAVIDNLLSPETPISNLPTFRRIIRYEKLSGSYFALSMNANLLKEIALAENGDPILITESTYGYIAEQFYSWCQSHMVLDGRNDKIIVAGKNFAGFDKRFLENLPGWKVKFHHRVLDPGVMYWHPERDGALPPDLQTCLQRAGISKEVTHNAVEDARDVIRLVRRHARVFSLTRA